MEVRLSYGQHGLVVDVPDGSTVVEPIDLPALVDEEAAVRTALRHPIAGPGLRELVGPNDDVAVVFPDLTRPMPNRTVLPPLLDELDQLGVGPDRIVLLCATGTHRRATPDEMEALIGADLVERYEVVDHQSDDQDHVVVGSVDGTEIALAARYVEAEVRIVTGFVEPHFFAGFSGGPKAVCPGLASTATVLAAHSPERIANPRSTWIRREGNPVHDFIRAATALAPPTLSLDVAINRDRDLTAAFCGPLPEAHDAACAFVESTSVGHVSGRFDVVVTTNGGYPLDRSLYQAVKGMAAAKRIVKPGGCIIMAASCVDGVPDHGGFARLLSAAGSPHDLVSTSGRSELDRWQVQVLGRVLSHADVFLFAEGLSSRQWSQGLIHLIDDVSEAVSLALTKAGPRATVCVLPEGPLMVATAV